MPRRHHLCSQLINVDVECSQVPKSNRRVVSTRGQSATIRFECEATNGAVVVLQFQSRLPGWLSIRNDNHGIFAGRCDESPITADSKRRGAALVLAALIQEFKRRQPKEGCCPIGSDVSDRPKPRGCDRDERGGRFLVRLG